MEDFNINNTLLNESFDANITDDHDNQIWRVFGVVHWVVSCVELLLTLVAIFAVLSTVKNVNGAPVYVLNFLVSDLIQLCGRIAIMLVGPGDFLYYWFAVVFCGFASVGFVVCISLERYLVIAKPLWYRFRRNIKTSLLVCVSVWILSFLLTLTIFLVLAKQTADIISGVLLLLPLPLFIFLLAGTIKALSEVRSVPADKKRRIVSILVVGLLIYAVICLPHIVFLLIQGIEGSVFHIVGLIFIFLGPLADSAVIIWHLQSASAFDKLLACFCFRKMMNSQHSNNDNGNT